MADIPSKKAKMCDEFFSMINKVLPPEMLKKVLELLDIQSLCYARQTCQHWKLIIDSCNIMKDVLGKILKSNYWKEFAGLKIPFIIIIFRKNILYNCFRWWRKHYCWSHNRRPRNQTASKFAWWSWDLISGSAQWNYVIQWRILQFSKVSPMGSWHLEET